MCIPLLKQLRVSPKKPSRSLQDRRATAMPTGRSAVSTVRLCMNTWLWRGVGIGRAQSAGKWIITGSITPMRHRYSSSASMGSSS